MLGDPSLSGLFESRERGGTMAKWERGGRMAGVVAWERGGRTEESGGGRGGKTEGLGRERGA